MKKNRNKVIWTVLLATIGLLSIQAQAADKTNTKIYRAANVKEFSLQLSAMINEAEEVYGDGSNASSENECALRRLLVQGETALNLEAYGASQILESEDHFYIMQFKTVAATQKALAALQARSDVRYAQADQVVTAEAADRDATVTAISDLTQSVTAGAAHNSWGVEAIEADQYAEYVAVDGDVSKSITVAVLDSGIDLDHPYFKGRLIQGYDYVDADFEPQDEFYHGTHVSGIIVDCTEGLNVKIRPIRVLDENGNGYVSVVCTGIRYAVEQGDTLINMSLSGPHSAFSSTGKGAYEDAVAYAKEYGALCVVAAGNNGKNTENYCPAHVADCITVSAVDSKNTRASFSNYGAAVDITAPGVSVYSCSLNGGYGWANGTSQAAPHITAAIAMIKLANPIKKWDEIENMLIRSCQDLGTAGWDSSYGYGIPKLSRLMQKEGWYLEDGNYRYYIADVLQTSKWLEIDGNWYYVNENGNRVSGWLDLEDQRFYLSDSGVRQTGFLTIDGSLYYFEAANKGAMSIGWKRVSGIWYYFSIDGAACKGLQLIDNKKYYFDSTTYQMVSGKWMKLNGGWYFFKVNGYAATGWLLTSSHFYYLSSEGVMQSGWQQIGGKWYYLSSPESGVMKTNTWQVRNGKKCYLGVDGAAVTGLIKIDQVSYYFDADGYIQTGWVTIDGQNYYFGSAQGGMITGAWKYLDGYYYYFDTNGMMHIGWLQLGKYRYYMDTNGKMQSGWQIIDGKLYYLSIPQSGLMAVGWKQIDTLWYYFNPSGNPLMGFATLGNYTYYFGSDCSMQTGWQTIDENRYYFGSVDSGVMTKGWKKLEEQWYYFAGDGKQCFGFKDIGRHTYYLNPENQGIMVTGDVTIGDKLYRFDANGALIEELTETETSAADTVAISGVMNREQTYLADIDLDGVQEMISYQESEGRIQIFIDRQLCYVSQVYPQWKQAASYGAVYLKSFGNAGTFVEIMMPEINGIRTEHTMLNLAGNVLHTWDLQQGALTSSEIVLLGAQMFRVETNVKSVIYLVNSGNIIAVTE